MVRRNDRNSRDQSESLVPETNQTAGAPAGRISGFERFTSFLLFFLIAVPLILFVLAFVFQLWGWIMGRGLVLDPWTTLVIFPLGLIVSPVFFYLGWYFQARAKGQYFDLEKAMGGYFLALCRTLYGILAAITILLAMIGVLGSAFIDSSLILVSWVVIAFVGVGIVSWLFQDIGDDENQGISLKPTGVAFILFSTVWLLFCISSLLRQDWAQFEGGVILFLVFLIPGIAAIRLSARRPPAPSKPPGDDSNSIV